MSDNDDRKDDQSKNNQSKNDQSKNNYIIEKSTSTRKVTKIHKPDHYIENYWFVLKIFIDRLGILLDDRYNDTVYNLSFRFNQWQLEETYILIISKIYDILFELVNDFIKKYTKKLHSEVVLLITNISRWNKCLIETSNEKLLQKYNINTKNYLINIRYDKKTSRSINNFKIIYLKILEKCEELEGIDFKIIISDKKKLGDQLIKEKIESLLPFLIDNHKIGVLEIIENGTKFSENSIGCKHYILNIIIKKLESELSDNRDEIEKLIKVKDTISISTLFRKYSNYL